MPRGQDDRSVYELTADEIRYALNWLDLLGTASPVLSIVRKEMSDQLHRLYHAKTTGEPIPAQSEDQWLW